MRSKADLQARARELRRAITPTEKLLWRHLRNRRFADWKFRRQHVVGFYIVDFYCAALKLVLELDGETHLGQETEDARRQGYLEKRGLRVLRFWNNQVFDELNAVLETIYQECTARVRTLPPLTPGPSPRVQGEGRPCIGGEGGGQLHESFPRRKP